VSRGLLAAGYQYVWLDGGWWDGGRDDHGGIVPPARQWPHGMRFLTDYIHAKGLRAGIYTDAGADGCGGDKQGSGPSKPGGADHYQQDVDQFAVWGFDAVKLDYCGGYSAGLDPETQYTQFSRAVANNVAHRPMLLNVCDPFTPVNGDLPLEESGYWSYTFSSTVANSWRTESDIGIPSGDRVLTWSDMIRNMNADAAHPEAAGPGHWNDPDYLAPELGMTAVEDQAQFTMWAMLAAPLMIGNDVRHLSDKAVTMLTDPEVIAVDQDPLGKQGVRVLDSYGVEVWSRPLATPGTRAVALLNLRSFTEPVSVSWRDLGIAGAASVRDLWAHADRGSFDSGYTLSVPSHGAALLIVSDQTSLSAPAVPAPTVAPVPVAAPPEAALPERRRPALLV
jgi:alpha-galactosidase